VWHRIRDLAESRDVDTGGAEMIGEFDRHFVDAHMAAL
jgi:hypothetical protein